MHWSEFPRLEALRDKWYGKAYVGDGADGEGRSESVGVWFPEDRDEDSAFAR